MADQPSIRVLFRFSIGLPYRQASAEEKKQVLALLQQMFQAWKAAGVRLIGTFGNQGAVDGFSHYIVLEVDDLSQVVAMDQAIMGGEVGRFVEKFSFHIGWKRDFVEEIWNSA
jgi:hypothetical protein